ncbi:MAG: succinate dehydrogenase assembly factor 2 [Methylococcaceae bacterium]|nr:succinate dehydrogenase assembly factor 2 [Methylococcaceae bacterium]
MKSLAKLKWHCRRGTKELDYLLEAYLEQHYRDVDKKEQNLFIELLSLPDTQLIFFLLGDQLPKSEGLSSLVKKIRNTTIYN